MASPLKYQCFNDLRNSTRCATGLKQGKNYALSDFFARSAARQFHHAQAFFSPLISMQIQKRLDLRAPHGAGLSGFFRAILKDDERGDATNAEARRHDLITVGIELGNDDAALVFVRDFVESRRHGLAGRTPVGVEIHNQGQGRLCYYAIEIGVAQPDRPVEQNRSAAAAALGSLLDAGEIDTIQPRAEGARHSGRTNLPRHVLNLTSAAATGQRCRNAGTRYAL